MVSGGLVRKYSHYIGVIIARASLKCCFVDNYALLIALADGTRQDGPRCLPEASTLRQRTNGFV